MAGVAIHVSVANCFVTPSPCCIKLRLCDYFFGSDNTNSYRNRKLAVVGMVLGFGPTLTITYHSYYIYLSSYVRTTKMLCSQRHSNHLAKS